MRTDSAHLVDEVAAQYGASHRAVHAVGIGLRGSFTPSPAAAAVSRAAVFAGGSVDVTARFSNSVGFPVLPGLPPNDTTPDVRGMAVKFRPAGSPQPDGALDMIAMTLDRFFDTVATFQGFLRHMAPSPTTGVVDKNALVEWAHEHLGAASVITAYQAVSATHDLTYAGRTYHGVHTFMYVNAAGDRTPARFVWVPDVPVAPVATLPPGTPSDFLRRDLTARCRAGSSVGFSLQLEHPGLGDDPNVLSKPWTSLDPTDPSGKTTIPPTVMGHLELGALVADQYWGCEALAFNPGRLVDGVETNPEDSIMAARQEAYAESHARRTAIYPPPSRVAG